MDDHIHLLDSDNHHDQLDHYDNRGRMHRYGFHTPDIYQEVDLEGRVVGATLYDVAIAVLVDYCRCEMASMTMNPWMVLIEKISATCTIST